MKILLINDYREKVGGAETFVYNLKSILEKKGHKTKILGSELKKENFASLFSRWYSKRWYRETINTINQFKPDIVHVNNFERIISPSPIVAALDKNIPIVLTLHDYQYFCPKSWAIYKDGKPCKYGLGYRCFLSNCKTLKNGYQYFPYQFLRCLKVKLHQEILKKNKNKITFVSPSKDLAKKVEQSLGVKVSVIPYGLTIPSQITNYQNIILFSGRITKAKGLQFIAGVLNQTEGYQSLILGAGPLKEELSRKYKNLKFLGFQNPVEFYKKASISVIPSIWSDNFPLAALEAMSYGLCVIASKIGGLPEIISHMKTGLLFTPENSNDFFKKLNYLINNPKEIQRMGKNARGFINNNLSWNRIFKKYENLYKKLLDISTKSKQ